MSDIQKYKETLQKQLKKSKIEVEIDVLSEHFSSIVTKWIPTGCLPLDSILGGGMPVGRIIEIYGDESTGKSLVAEQIAAEALQAGHYVIYADSEAAISLAMLEAVGMDVDQLLYFIPETMEDVLKTFDAAIDTKPKDKVLLLVWDSVAASAAKAEMDKTIGDPTVAPQARLMSAALRRLATKISKSNVAIVLINQTRAKIGVMFGSSVATTGGNAIKFYSSVRIELAIKSKITEGKKIVHGVIARAYTTKNKVAKPFQQCELPILFDQGIDDVAATLEYLKDKDIIKTKGAWYSCDFWDKNFQSDSWPQIYDEKFEEIVKLLGLS